MRGKSGGFTLIELLIVVVIIGILAIAAIPIIRSNTQDAKLAESRSTLGVLKDRLRTKYLDNDRTVNTSWTLADIVNTSELGGKFYGAGDYSMSNLTNSTVSFSAAANTTTDSPQTTLSITDIATGAGDFTTP